MKNVARTSGERVNAEMGWTQWLGLGSQGRLGRVLKAPTTTSLVTQ